MAGLRSTGPSLLLVGFMVAVTPHVIALFFGRYVLKMNPVILLGACAGAGTVTAALRAVQDEAGQQAPGARIHRALRDRQHPAHRVGTGDRPAHPLAWGRVRTRMKLLIQWIGRNAMIRSPFVAGRAPVALVTALSLVFSPALPLLASQTPAPASSPTPAPKAATPKAAAGAPKAAAVAPKAAAPAVPVDGGWPRAYSTPSGGRIVVYQPQVASWA